MLVLSVHSLKGICWFARTIDTQMVLATVVTCENCLAFIVYMFVAAAGTYRWVVGARNGFVVKAPGHPSLTSYIGPCFHVGSESICIGYHLQRDIAERFIGTFFLLMSYLTTFSTDVAVFNKCYKFFVGWGPCIIVLSSTLRSLPRCFWVWTLLW